VPLTASRLGRTIASRVVCGWLLGATRLGFLVSVRQSLNCRPSSPAALSTFESPLLPNPRTRRSQADVVCRRTRHETRCMTPSSRLSASRITGHGLPPFWLAAKTRVCVTVIASDRSRDHRSCTGIRGALQVRLIGFGIIMPKNMWKVKPVTMNLQLRYSGCGERNAARVVD
jgi:hypothetical protein